MTPTRETHVFVGTFRPTRDEMRSIVERASGQYRTDCPLKHSNSTVQGMWDCWQKGCYDEPLYRPIEDALKPEPTQLAAEYARGRKEAAKDVLEHLQNRGLSYGQAAEIHDVALGHPD